MGDKPLEDSTGWRRAMRREMVTRRSGLSVVAHAEKSAEIVRILRSTVPRPNICAFCWPIKHEPDVLAVVQSWRTEGTIAALPVVIWDDLRVGFCYECRISRHFSVFGVMAINP